MAFKTSCARFGNMKMKTSTIPKLDLVMPLLTRSVSSHIKRLETGEIVLTRRRLCYVSQNMAATSLP